MLEGKLGQVGAIKSKNESYLFQDGRSGGRAAR
jgi:hypothetical protein